MKMFNKRLFVFVLAVLLAGCGDDEPGGGIIVGGPDNGGGDTEDPVYLQENADFPIGNIVSANRLSSNTADNQTFREVLLNDFNSITAENDMKMANFFMGPDSYDYSDGDAIVAYAKANGLRVHGHALIWHQSIPGWLNNYGGTDGEFEDLIENYVKSTVAHFAEATDDDGNPIVASWDVVNEYWDGGSVRSSLFTQRMGDDFHEKVFTWAREADPDVKLFYNDYNIAGTPVKRNAIISMVNDFQSKNIPIDGIGMQMHLNHDWPTSDLPVSITDIAATGLLVHVSELDVKVNFSNDISEFTSARAAAQATQYQRVSYLYSTIVPESQQFGITIWGFRDQDSWLYEGGSDWPLLYDNDFENKPAYEGFRDGLNEVEP